MPLSLQVTKDSISNVQCSTQIYVNQAKFSTNFIGHETKTLINLHLSICDTLHMKFYYGDTKIVIFLPKNPYKLKEKRQVRGGISNLSALLVAAVLFCECSCLFVQTSLHQV